MMGGAYYKPEELERMRKLMDNSPEGITDLALARLAIDYGICTGRTETAIAQKVRLLRENQINSQESDNTEQPLFDWATDGQIAILQKELKDIKSNYNSLLKAILDNATLYRYDTGVKVLHFEYRFIKDWLLAHEPERLNARYEALMLEDN